MIHIFDNLHAYLRHGDRNDKEATLFNSCLNKTAIDHASLIAVATDKPNMYRVLKSREGITGLITAQELFHMACRAMVKLAYHDPKAPPTTTSNETTKEVNNETA